MDTAVLQTSFLGDMILTTPLLERLAERGRVVVVATPANAALLANHRAVSDVIVFDKRGRDRGIHGVRRVAAQLRAANVKAAYLAQGSVRTAALAWLAHIPVRIGFETSPGRLLYTSRIPLRRELHHAVRLWQLASDVDDATTPTSLRPTLFPSADDFARADALLTLHGVTADAPLVALAPGSVWATKRWPSYDALAAVIARHAALRTHRLVILGAANEQPLATSIIEAVRSSGAALPIDSTGQLSLLGSAAMLSRVRALITNDSAPLHLASAMNTPTIALFGPTIPAFGFGPLAERSDIVERQSLACRPCHAHGPQTCPLGHWHCMREITAGSVAQRLHMLLAPGQI